MPIQSIQFIGSISIVLTFSVMCIEQYLLNGGILKLFWGWESLLNYELAIKVYYQVSSFQGELSRWGKHNNWHVACCCVTMAEVGPLPEEAHLSATKSWSLPLCLQTACIRLYATWHGNCTQSLVSKGLLSSSLVQLSNVHRPFVARESKRYNDASRQKSFWAFHDGRMVSTPTILFWAIW